MAELPRTLVRRVAHNRARSEMFRPARVGIDDLAKALGGDDANEAIDDSNDPGLVECPHCGFVGPAEAVRRHREREGHEEAAPDEDADVEASFIAKATRPTQRYTLGVLYMADRLDHHGEFSDADTLQKSLWDYNLNSDKKLRLQHGSKIVGSVVEAFQLPFDHEADLTSADGTVRKQKCPSGTVYVGCVWTPEAWKSVLSGAIQGYSMGGSCIRVHGVPLP